jgi:hypothetical protein
VLIVSPEGGEVSSVGARALVAGWTRAVGRHTTAKVGRNVNPFASFQGTTFLISLMLRSLSGKIYKHKSKAIKYQGYSKFYRLH